MQATDGTTTDDVVIVGDDQLRLDVLAEAFSHGGMRVGRRHVAEGGTAAAAVVVLDLVDADRVHDLEVTAERVVALRGTRAPGLVDEVEVLDLDTPVADAVRALVGDGAPLPRRERAATDVAGGPSPLDELTDRERDVLRQLLTGDDGEAIGDRLGISAHTVRTHVQNVLAKLDVHSRADAAVIALDAGMSPPSQDGR